MLVMVLILRTGYTEDGSTGALIVYPHGRGFATARQALRSFGECLASYYEKYRKVSDKCPGCNRTFDVPPRGFNVDGVRMLLHELMHGTNDDIGGDFYEELDAYGWSTTTPCAASDSWRGLVVVESYAEYIIADVLGLDDPDYEAGRAPDDFRYAIDRHVDLAVGVELG